MRTFSSDEELQAAVGQELGVSDWFQITQEQVNKFADATYDHQWIHVDVEKAKQGPFGGPIAHGYLTLSLTPHLSSQCWRIDGAKMGVNYGLNKLRFVSPVKVGSKIRVRATLNNVEPKAGGTLMTVGLTYEIEGEDKPAASAEALFLHYR